MKFAVVIVILFFIVVVAEGRRCRYFISGVECSEECCGKEDDMRCLKSCKNVACSNSDDCGKGCCKNGKCTAPDGSTCEDTVTTIIAVCVAVGIVVVIIVAVFFLVRYCRRRSANPGMIILVNQQWKTIKTNADFLLYFRLLTFLW